MEVLVIFIMGVLFGVGFASITYGVNQRRLVKCWREALLEAECDKTMAR